MQLFYNPEINSDTKSFFFEKEESGHIIKVLRKQTDDILFVTNGLGFLFEVKIIIASEKKCVVEIVAFQQNEPKKPKLHLAVAPTKMNDRYEWFLEKATEIGFDSLTPIICDRSERKIIKTERFEKIVVSAMKQSLQTFLPKINAPVTLKEFLKNDFTNQKFIAHCLPDQKKDLKTELAPNQSALILIGPEGDFSDKEINLALEKGFIPISLGENRLRTETAALVATMCFDLTQKM